MSNFNLTKSDILAGGIIFGFAAVAAFAIDAHLKMRKAANKLEIAAKDLYEETVINVPDELVQRTVERAAKDEAKYQVSKAMDKVAKDIAKTYESDIKTAVEDEFKLQKDSLTKTLRKKIDDVDINEIKREVKAEAKSYVADKLKKDLDDISDKYTDQIESMSSIYSTIASKIESIGE